MTIKLWLNEEPVDIDREDIAHETDCEYLKELREDIQQAADELTILAKSESEFGIQNQSLAYKISRYRIAEHWMTKRLDILNVSEPTGKQKEQAAQITKLLAQNAELKLMVRNLGGEVL